MTCISLPCGKPLHIVLIPGRSSRTAKFSVKNRNWKTLVKTSFTGDSSPSNNIKPTTGRETGSGRSNFHCRLYGPCLLNALVRDSGVCGSVIPLQAAIAIGDRPAAGSKLYEISIATVFSENMIRSEAGKIAFRQGNSIFYF